MKEGMRLSFWMSGIPAVAFWGVLGGGAWWLTAAMALDFAREGGGWTGASFWALFGMWGAMMAAMMMASAIPFLRLFWRCCQHRGLQVFWHSAAAGGGYLVLWLLFSAAAAAAHWAADEWQFLNDNIALASSEGRAGLLALAGLYQLTPLKTACLRGCRPAAWQLILHWRRGLGGAFLTGAGNGAFCVGCCWALMLLLFVGGAMDLRWIVALAFYALLEKLLPPSPWLARLTGGGLLAAAVVVLVGY